MTFGYLNREFFNLGISSQQERDTAAEREREQERIALADPYPATVSYGHFIRRGLAAAIEAGRCTVTMGHPLFGSSLPGVPVVDIQFTPDYSAFFLITADGSEFKRYGKGHLTVTWHDFGDTWKKLSPAMRRALHSLATASPLSSAKPGEGPGVRLRKNTLRALEARRLVENGQLTPSALALYRQHKQEFLSDGN